MEKFNEKILNFCLCRAKPSLVLKFFRLNSCQYDKQIMRTIIFGAGSAGLALARRLIEEKRDVLLIDNDEQTVKALANKIDCPVVLSENDLVKTLNDVEISQASRFIAISGDDEINLLACRLAAGLNRDLVTICRVKTLAYAALADRSKELLGVDYVLNSRREAAQAVINSMRRGFSRSSVYFGDARFLLRVMRLDSQSALVGKAVSQLRANAPLPFVVGLVVRGETYIIPKGNDTLAEGDLIYFFGEKEALAPFFGDSDAEQNVQRLIIAGGDEIGTQIASRFLEGPGGRFWHSVKNKMARAAKSLVFVEPDSAKCLHLAEIFPAALIINADIADEGVLSQASASAYDMFVACENNQEKNLISAAYVKGLGIKQTAAVVIKDSYAALSALLAIDTVISLRDNMVDAILKIVLGKRVRNVYNLFGGQAEIYELLITADSKAVGHDIKGIAWPEKCLALYIVRQGAALLPSGDLVLQGGDAIGVVALSGETLLALKEILA